MLSVTLYACFAIAMMETHAIKNNRLADAGAKYDVLVKNSPERLRPTSLIIDTDLGNDIDDALALMMAYSLESDGECRVLGVAVNKDNYYSAAFVDLLSTFYGRGGVEIGVVKDGKTPDDGLFIRPTCEDKIGTAYKYKRSRNRYEMDAVAMYRKLLAESRDGSVVIASIGFFTNLARLLVSGPDCHSPLNGAELVSQKVHFVSAMAGKFSDSHVMNSDGREAEYNVHYDIESAQYVCRHWPTPIIFSGNEVGAKILYPAESILNDFGWAAHHPVVDSYQLFKKMPYDRPTWDLTSVLYAVRPHHRYFELSARGTVVVDDAGVTSFVEDKNGLHQHLIVVPDAVLPLQRLMIDFCIKKTGVPESRASLK